MYTDVFENFHVDQPKMTGDVCIVLTVNNIRLGKLWNH